MKEHQTLRAILKSHDLPLVLSTLCMKKGPSYRGVGARMVSDGNKILSGSISGGCIEGDLLLKMKEVLKTGQSQLIPYDLSNDAVILLAMGWDVMELFLSYFRAHYNTLFTASRLIWYVKKGRVFV